MSVVDLCLEFQAMPRVVTVDSTLADDQDISVRATLSVVQVLSLIQIDLVRGLSLVLCFMLLHLSDI